MNPAIILLLAAAALVIILNLFKTSGHTKVTIGNATVNAEVADTFLKQSKGLMGRKSLKEDEGMLFVFNIEQYHRFWMLNMSIPIDIIFLGKDKTVVDILKNAQPCGLSCESYTPKEKAMYVLEAKANFTERHRIRIGTKADFNLS
jgi:uncharacterized membrane protein (UPF0127 family)